MPGHTESTLLGFGLLSSAVQTVPASLVSLSAQLSLHCLEIPATYQMKNLSAMAMIRAALLLYFSTTTKPTLLRDPSLGVRLKLYNYLLSNQVKKMKEPTSLIDYSQILTRLFWTSSVLAKISFSVLLLVLKTRLTNSRLSLQARGRLFCLRCLIWAYGKRKRRESGT